MSDNKVQEVDAEEVDAHWLIYRNAAESPSHPWFVEHRIRATPEGEEVDMGHSRWAEQMAPGHEYGSFETVERAELAAQLWYRSECASVPE